MALVITTYFEGGKSMNYQALTGDGDNQGTSFGLLQWNFGQNTLGPLLKKMMNANAAVFAGCFGPAADYDTLNKALQTGDQNGELKWARGLLKTNKSAWADAFKKIGSVEAFNKIQRDQAIALYHPRVVTAIKTIREISPTLFAKVQFKSYAALFDLCVQQGGLKNTSRSIKKRVGDEKPASQLELMKIVVTERAQTANSGWVADCTSRRTGILTAAPFKSAANNVTTTRTNPNFRLINQFGNIYVQGL